MLITNSATLLAVILVHQVSAKIQVKRTYGYGTSDMSSVSDWTEPSPISAASDESPSAYASMSDSVLATALMSTASSSYASTMTLPAGIPVATGGMGSAGMGWQGMLPVYGSGSSMGRQAFRSCVETCQASFMNSGRARASPYTTSPSMYASTTVTGMSSVDSSSMVSSTESASAVLATVVVSSGGAASPYVSSGSSSSNCDGSSTANGEIVAGPNEVVVAPKKGDLRMVPFAITVKAGTDVSFLWGAGPHTVTQSTLGGICNKSTETGAFASGQQNATFKYTTTIAQDSSPTFYYCGVKTHCQQGMFGVINPQTATSVEKSFGSWMEKHASNNPDFNTMMKETKRDCEGNSDAWSYGQMYDLTLMDKWSMPFAAESIMKTRSYYARQARLLVADNTTSPADDPSSSNTAAATLLAAPTVAVPTIASTSTSSSSTAAAGRSSLSSGSTKVTASIATLATLLVAGVLAMSA